MTAPHRRPSFFQHARHVFALCLTSAALCLSVNVHAAKIQEVRSVEGITEYALDNGLQLLLFPDPSKNTITVNVTYHVGSKHENYGETGMAHLLEHLLFKGSKKHPDITKELTDVGAKTNGSTWYERTNYYETFKATEENLAWALSMEADRMVNSFVAKEDLDSEMTVVRNEFERGENNPSYILLQRIYGTAFHWHNYGKSTIGARSDIENVDIENLRRFYEKYYQPDNATLIIAGKFDTDFALKHIRKTFGKLRKPKRVLQPFYTREPVQDGERELTLRRVGGDQIVAAAYHIPSGLHEDFPALDILASILGDAPTGRLHTNLTDKKLATSTWAWANQQHAPSLLYFNATASMQTDLSKTETALISSLEGLAFNPITEEEVHRAKRKLLKNIGLSFNNSQELSINLSEWIGIGDWRMMFIHRDRIERVTLEDVQRVANHYLVPANRTLGRFIPDNAPKRAEISAAPDVASIVEGYQGRKNITQGEAFTATLDAIAKREIRSEKNGIKITALPIKTRGESVHLDLRMGIGNVTSLQGKTFLRDLATDMLLRGTSRFNRSQLQDEFDKLQAQGGFTSDEQGIYAHYETTREHLPQLIELIVHVLREPNFSDKEFSLLKTQRISQLESLLTDPQALAFRAMSTQLNLYPSDHMFHKPSLNEEIQGIESATLPQLKQFYQTHTGGDNIQVGLVGDFDRERIEKQLVNAFSDWDNRVSYAFEAKKYQAIKQDSQRILTPDKKNAFFIAGGNVKLSHTDKDAAAFYIATRILGGGFINSRLASRIRQQDGLSYSIGAYAQLALQDNNGRWFAYAISAPDNTAKVEQAFTEEMQRAYDKGFSQEEVDAAVEGLLDEIRVKLSDNQNLVQTLRTYHSADYSVKDEEALQKNMRALSADDVNRVMRKYLQSDQLSIIKAGDFSE